MQMKRNGFDEDVEVVEKASKGDVLAFKKLYESNKGRIYNYALRMTNDRDAANEITQEIFVKAYRHLKRLRKKDSFKSWLMAIAVNFTKDFLKYKRRKGEIFDDNKRLQQIDNFESNESPESLFLENEMKDAVIKSLSMLKPFHREIIVLYYIEGFSIKEIASIISVSEGTVKSRLSRAREEISKELRRLGF
ncbi:MAG: RNA polymerase sigma factor [Candidatus Schekmanbacteria bacterium]|nr:MAG: RNA polymerase sigma factor [Candidatus Schekmanbacteria bacterium]